MLFRNLISAGVICLAGAAQSAVVEGTFSGTVSVPTGATSSIVTFGGGSGQLIWGSPTYYHPDTSATGSSSLTVSNGPFSVASADAFANPVLLGTITWHNESNWHTGTRWNSMLDLAISFLAPAVPGPLTEQISFSVVNTSDPTNNTDANETTGLNPDRIPELVLGSGPFGVPLSLGGGITLNNVYFGLESPGSAGTNIAHDGLGRCAFGPAGNKVGSFYNSSTGTWKNCEGNTSVLGVYGQFSTGGGANTPVPEVSATGSLAAVASLLALMAFLWERRNPVARRDMAA